MNRRQFLILSTSAAVCGCAGTSSPENGAIQLRSVRIDAGPASAFAADGVYDRFRDQGFFILRKGNQLTALSAICTHRRCKLEAEADKSFYCPCHGSCFDPAGKVTEGPATRDLPTLPTTIDQNGHLLVLAVG